MTLVVRHAVRTDIGLHREVNEDAAVVEAPLYAVCDGMGGAKAGEVASQLACATLVERTATGDDLAGAAQAANGAVYAAAGDDPDLKGMGTTLTAMVVEGSVARLAHVGDSRAYLLRDGVMRQVTADHSVVGQMIRRGELTVEQAAKHPMRSILTRALGTEPEVEVDGYEVDLRGGDVILLCSDGLTGMVPDERIEELLGRDDPERSAAELVEHARRGGGVDNITVVVVLFEERDDDPSTSRTVEAPAPAADEGSPTLPGAGPDAVPAVHDDETAATASTRAEGAQTAAPRRARDARLQRRLKIVLAVLLVVLVLAVAAAVALQSFYFLGVDDGEVVVFSGLPWSAGPLEIKDVYVRGTLRYDTLSIAQRRLVDQSRIQSRDEALRLLQTLEALP